jgi:hypothetical protein
MKLFELMAKLRLWPFDGEVRVVERPEDRLNDDISYAQRAIVLPAEMRGAVHAARWPSGYDRRNLH